MSEPWLATEKAVAIRIRLLDLLPIDVSLLPGTKA
jgi:hypothetical protein